MAMYYNVSLNQGNEALGSGKSITVNEVLNTVDEHALAHHIHLHNQLIPEQVAESVLQNFIDAAAELMSMGFAIQLRNKQDVALRIYPDIHVKGGNITLEKAREIDPTVTDLTLENAGELVSRVGVTVRARAEVEQKFTDLLLSQGASLERKEVVERAYVQKKDGSDEGENGNGSGSDNDNGGGDNPPSGGGENEE